MLIDTDLEKDMELGIPYPFPALEAGQCVISKTQKDLLNLEVGMNLTLTVYMDTMLNYTATVYNREIAGTKYEKVGPIAPIPA